MVTIPKTNNMNPLKTIYKPQLLRISRRLDAHEVNCSRIIKLILHQRKITNPLMSLYLHPL